MAESPARGSRTALVTVVTAAAIGFAVAIGGFNLGRSLFGPIQGLDFSPYYVTGQMALKGKIENFYLDRSQFAEVSLEYGVPSFTRGDDVFVTTNAYPPSAVLMLAPVAGAPWDVARILFFGLSAAAIVWAMLLVAGIGDTEGRRARQLIAVIAASVFFPTWYSLYLGQVNPILLLLVVATLILLRKGKFVASGMAVGVATMLKLFPGGLAVFLIVKKQWLAATAALATGLAIVLASLPFTGIDLWREYVIDVLPSQVSAGANYRNQGFEGFFARLLTDNEFVASLGDFPVLASWLSLLSGIGLFVYVTWLSRRPALIQSTRWAIEYSLSITVIVLALAKSWEHYGIFFLPLYVLLFNELLLRKSTSERDVPVVPVAGLFASFTVWAFLLQAGTDYESLPDSLIMNPVYSIKFFATLLLVGVAIWYLKTTPVDETRETDALMDVR